MQDRLRQNSKIEFAWNATITEVYGETTPYKTLKGVKLKLTTDGSIRDLKIDGLFLAIGHEPNTAIFKDKLALTPEGYLLTRACSLGRH